MLGIKNVLFMVYYFPPLGGSGVQRALKFFKYLRDFRRNPVVICPITGDHPDIPLNTSVITHGFDPVDFNGTVKPTLEYKSKKFNLLYGGLFYESNQPDVFLKSVKRTGSRVKDKPGRFLTSFSGSFDPRIKDYVNDLDMGNSVTDCGCITHSIAVTNVQKSDA
ncbi:hypothetical protein ACKGJO_02980 [Gracilimonas sp. Q87]|uniref:hypothetical protein n=1 Tax=Gracilimonas sp. Q87 TaxID=3384766 RepID=UPI0039841E78